MDVSDHRLQVQLTQEAEKPTDFFFGWFFCVCGLYQHSEAAEILLCRLNYFYSFISFILRK